MKLEQASLAQWPSRNELVRHGHGFCRHGRIRRRAISRVDVPEQGLHLGNGKARNGKPMPLASCGCGISGTRSKTKMKARNSLFADTAPAAVGKRKQQPTPICVPRGRHPSVGVKRIRVREHVRIRAVHRVRLTADDGLLGDVEAVNGSAAQWHEARQRHGDRRVIPKTLAQDGVQERKLVDAGVGVPSDLLGQSALQVKRPRLGKLPHEEAQRVAGGVDAGDHVVQAFGGHVDVVEVA